MKYFAIGDIHGCLQELESLVAQLPLTTDSVLIFLGDYIDRGSNSAQVIEYLLRLKRERNVVFLKGNHEDLFQRFLFEPESTGAGLFVLNGGGSTLLSYSDAESPEFYKIPQAHLDFLSELKVFYQTEDYFFVHAGVPEIPLTKIDLDQHEATMLWVRQPFLSSSYDWGKVIVHGHTPVWDPEVSVNRINVDTGLVYDGMLTAVELPSLKFYQEAKKAKAEPTRYLQSPGFERPMRFRGTLPVLIERDGYADRYETLNYNQGGLLMRELRVPASRRLSMGDRVRGEIGDSKAGFIDFEGEVVRVESRDETVLLGIKITRSVTRV